MADDLIRKEGINFLLFTFFQRPVSLAALTTKTVVQIFFRLIEKTAATFPNFSPLFPLSGMSPHYSQFSREKKQILETLILLN